MQGYRAQQGKEGALISAHQLVIAINNIKATADNIAAYPPNGVIGFALQPENKADFSQSAKAGIYAVYSVSVPSSTCFTIESEFDNSKAD